MSAPSLSSTDRPRHPWEIHYQQMTGIWPSSHHPHDENDVCLMMKAFGCPDKDKPLEWGESCAHCLEASDAWLAHYYIQCHKPADPNHPATKDCPDQTCYQCAVRDCPHHECLHYDCNDGCPSCWAAEQQSKKASEASSKPLMRGAIDGEIIPPTVATIMKQAESGAALHPVDAFIVDFYNHKQLLRAACSDAKSFKEKWFKDRMEQLFPKFDKMRPSLSSDEVVRGLDAMNEICYGAEEPSKSSSSASAASSSAPMDTPSTVSSHVAEFEALDELCQSVDDEVEEVRSNLPDRLQSAQDQLGIALTKLDELKAGLSRLKDHFNGPHSIRWTTRAQESEAIKQKKQAIVYLLVDKERLSKLISGEYSLHEIDPRLEALVASLEEDMD